MIDRTKENENEIIKNKIKKPEHHTITIYSNEEIETNLSSSPPSVSLSLKEKLIKHKYILFIVMFCFVATLMIQIIGNKETKTEINLEINNEFKKNPSSSINERHILSDNDQQASQRIGTMVEVRNSEDSIISYSISHENLQQKTRLQMINYLGMSITDIDVYAVHNYGEPVSWENGFELDEMRDQPNNWIQLSQDNSTAETAFAAKNITYNAVLLVFYRATYYVNVQIRDSDENIKWSKLYPDTKQVQQETRDQLMTQISKTSNITLLLNNPVYAVHNNGYEVHWQYVDPKKLDDKFFMEDNWIKLLQNDTTVTKAFENKNIPYDAVLIVFYIQPLATLMVQIRNSSDVIRWYHLYQDTQIKQKTRKEMIDYLKNIYVCSKDHVFAVHNSGQPTAVDKITNELDKTRDNWIQLEQDDTTAEKALAAKGIQYDPVLIVFYIEKIETE